MNKAAKYSIFVVAAGVLISGLTGCEKEQTRQQAFRQEAPSVKVRLLTKRPQRIWVEYTSKTEAFEMATVTARVGGEILAQTFKAGDKVRKGAVLFHIDKSDYLAAYNRALAQLEKDRAALEMTEADLARYRPLVEEKLAPRQKYEQLEAARRELLATIRADRVLVEDAKLKLGYCDIKAPIGGTIGREFVKPGNLVSPGTKLASIIESRRLQVTFFPSSKEVAEIRHYAEKPRPDVEIFLRGNPAIRLRGSVDYIAGRADETTGTVAMRATIDNPGEKILPGSFVIVRLIVHRKIPAVSISPDWVFQDQQGEFLYVLDDNDTLRKAHFVSPFSNDEMVILPDEFAGRRALVQPAGSLVEGSRVRPLPADGNGTSGG